MKKKLLLLLLLPVLALASCVKQKNCDCELPVTGKFVYYENQKEIIYCGRERNVNAVIVADKERLRDYYIVGSIPKKFQMQDTVYVTACLKQERQRGCLAYGIGSIYKLTCIEKED